jgi:antagonist of KipI
VSIVVRQAGVLTTVQDLGRPGWQHLGVPVGGAMDATAHRTANLCVGNADTDATIECTLGAVALQFDAPALIALAGRDITASLDGAAISAWRPIAVKRGALLAVHTGCRTSIAVAGGVNVPVVLDARSTVLRGGFGGFEGRALRREDRLAIGVPTPLGEAIANTLGAGNRIVGDFSAGWSLRPDYSASPIVRVIEGPEYQHLTDASRQAFLDATFRVAPDSDRMGFRLAGHTLTLTSEREVLSSGVTAGTIQLPPGGAPIVLMADRQTTGGYPRLGDLIAVDLPLMAQLRPGDSVRFQLTGLDEAHDLYRKREQDFASARHALQMRYAMDLT